MARQLTATEWVVEQIMSPPRRHNPPAAPSRERVYSVKAAKMARDALATAATPLSIEQIAQEFRWTINQAEYRVRSGLAHDLVIVVHRPTTRAGRVTYRAAEED